ncbi:DUF1579 family protein [Algoriphagus sp. D3-2-R+10]|uniref:DUF1579 family protein n=1 Tax=Algoriphagus aurantiacus TaxID=3103948 RepID=UPI002B3A20F3|nr:DUF1579 family protein [Algoriphagus sp. D3-2-R+10]MEB2778101.1 DUF1579 family protein [Algoriphagus sp. D3-2-R+10]
METNRIENTHFNKLIGKWRTEGVILETDSTPEMEISGMDTYEFILDGFYILHKADVLMNKERNQTYEIIALDNADGRVSLTHYNNQGLSGKMTGSLLDNELLIHGEELRFTGQFSTDENQIEGTWEKLVNHKDWVKYLHMHFFRIE